MEKPISNIDPDLSLETIRTSNVRNVANLITSAMIVVVRQAVNPQQAWL